MADQLDDFEFKPLTEGLGFHKKVLKLKEEMEQPASAPAKVVTPISPSTIAKKISALPNLDFENNRAKLTFEEGLLENPSKRPLVSKTLPRVEDTSALLKEDRRSNVSSYVLPTPGTKAVVSAKVEKAEKLEKQTATSNKIVVENEVEVWSETTAHAAAIFFDAVAVFGMVNLFIAAMLLVTEVDFAGVMSSASTDSLTRLSLVVLTLVVQHLYMIISRTFFAQTIGEWAFDIRLGKESEIKTALYPLKVAWRCFANTITGIIAMPLLSWIMKTDAASLVGGMQLYRRK